MNDCNYFWVINQVSETRFLGKRHVEKKYHIRRDQPIKIESLRLDL